MAVNDSGGGSNGAGSDAAGPQKSPLMEKVLAALGDLVAEHQQERGDDRIHVARENIGKAARSLCDHPELKFDLLLDVTAIDYLGQPDGFRLGPDIWDRKEALTRRFRQSRHRLVLPARGPLPRFAVVYHLFSTSFFHRLRIKCRVPEEDPVIPTVTGVWPGANWLERETYDMYGIRFSGHPDLRRIYLYDEFVGHPLRKDYGKQNEQPIQEFLGPAADYPRRPE
jgi:NADH-quinone oxidoreductase subunit C